MWVSMWIVGITPAGLDGIGWAYVNLIFVSLNERNKGACPAIMKRIHLALVTGLASLVLFSGTANAHVGEHKIEQGDSLSKIAAAHNTDWRRLWFKNLYIINPDLIYTGKTLTVPAPDEVLAERALPSAPAPTPPPVARVAPKPAPKPAPQPAASYGSGCDWLAGQLAANGISQGDIPAAINIASRESGCNPRAVNRSSGACNVFQELPCGKWGGTGNLSAHIRGADSYAKNRYGGWWGAYRAWQAKHWW